MAIKITRPERTVKLCTDAALRADWEAADEALRDALKDKGQDRMIGNPKVAELTAEVERLQNEMRESVVHFRLRALRRSKWAELIAQNPPADDATENDKQFGANVSAFFDAAIPESIVGVTDHQGNPVAFDTEAEWDDFADEMTNRQFDDLANAVLVLNRGSVDIPFSRAASRTRQDSSES